MVAGECVEGRIQQLYYDDFNKEAPASPLQMEYNRRYSAILLTLVSDTHATYSGLVTDIAQSA